MKVPLSWLKDYVDLDVPVDEITKRLTFSGVEVEGVETVGAVYEGLVVGEILAVDPHPSADRLKLCRVFDGARECRVVCGAPNVRVGDKAPFAGIGSRLPSGMKIRQAKIRGEVSEGMLCAEDEIGISKDHTGLMILPSDTGAGTPLAEVLGPPDTVFELEITWNRPDCLSLIGIAREMAALFGTTVRLPPVDVVEAGAAVETLARVRIEDPVGCPRYTARILSNVRLGPSPFWMQRRLAMAGVRPISNVVDITNYVMLECGQPLHAFDYELLGGHEIVVRRSRPGEKMATLDGVERPITPEDLLIADAARPVAVAGVMGGEGSEIRDETRTVLLESACFDPASIHRTSSRLGLSTEAAHRFERTVDVGGADFASRRAAALMVQLAGAEAARGVIDAYPGKPAERRVACRYQRTRDLLGVAVTDAEIAAIFESLELPVVAKDAGSCTVRVPTFRGDLEIEADLIEEVARMHGLEKVSSDVPAACVVPDADDSRTRALVACRSNLVGLGLTEIMNYSFLSQELLDAASTADAAERVALPNPVSADYAVMRNSLVPQMIDTLGRNFARQVADAAFFEIGKVFRKTAEGRIVESERLCVGIMGRVGRIGLDLRKPLSPEEPFLWLKGILESLCRAQHAGDVAVQPIEDRNLEPGWAVAVTARGERLGTMGIVRASIRKPWRLVEPVAVAELDTAALLSGAFSVPTVRPVPAYPGVSRDVAMIVADAVTHDAIVGTIRRAAPPELTDVALFDIFSGKLIGEGRKSLAYSLVYRSMERTLTDEEANGFHETIKKALRDELSAEIRES